LHVRAGAGSFAAEGSCLMNFTPSEGWEARITSSFARQGLMTTMGAVIHPIAPGIVEIAVVPSPAISQQHGFVHGGAVSAIADTAAGYAAVSLMPPGTAALTTELKINFMAPAGGERIVARGEVVKAGRTLTVVQTNVFTETGGTRKLIALLIATIMTLEAKGGFSD
jgi:uncharacterized protein (TIGR00369 family)